MESRVKHITTVALFIAFLLAVSIAVPVVNAQAKERQYQGPALSGTLSSVPSFLNETPGVGIITKIACTDGTNLGGGNIRINCDSVNLPHNEMTIAVDPRNPDHIVAGSNDYELFFVGNTVIEKIIAGYYTSFDGGSTWLNGRMPNGGFSFTGDPAVAFNNKSGLIHYGVLAFNGFGTGVSIQVSTSSDGGLTYGKPVVVARGIGFARISVFNDKPYITVDNNPNSPFYGRLYVTWTRFLSDQFGSFIESPIFFAFSDDGGKTFSQPKEISGSNLTLCANPLIPANTGKCNEDQFSSPIVAPDGTLYVAFENDEFQGAPNFRNQYLIVRSKNGGQTFEGPFQAVFPIYDGFNDYPINVDSRQTLSNSQFRVNSAGNLAADSTSGRLYISFSDNRNGNNISTNTDIFVVVSNDGGATWGNPNPVLTGSASQNDQFFPWAAVNSTGALKVAFSDRSYDPQNIQYGETLATSIDNGVTFTSVRVDTGLSSPNDSRWFTNGGQTQGNATFIGDYNALDIGSDGVAHPIWTDMRVSQFPNPPPGRGHNTQDAVTASIP